jgi:hypothetical protein
LKKIAPFYYSGKKKTFFIDPKAKTGKFSHLQQCWNAVARDMPNVANGKKDTYLVNTPFPSVIDHDGLPGT